MPKIGTVRCGARTELDDLLFSVEVSVNKDGVFTTTLDEGTVTRLKEYGLPMKANRLGRLGVNVVFLQVIPNTWVYDWYIRRGYSDFGKCDDGLVELIKRI